MNQRIPVFSYQESFLFLRFFAKSRLPLQREAGCFLYDCIFFFVAIRAADAGDSSIKRPFRAFNGNPKNYKTPGERCFIAVYEALNEKGRIRRLFWDLRKPLSALYYSKFNFFSSRYFERKKHKIANIALMRMERVLVRFI